MCAYVHLLLQLHLEHCSGPTSLYLHQPFQLPTTSESYEPASYSRVQMVLTAFWLLLSLERSCERPSALEFIPSFARKQPPTIFDLLHKL